MIPLSDNVNTINEQY